MVLLWRGCVTLSSMVSYKRIELLCKTLSEEYHPRDLTVWILNPMNYTIWVNYNISLTWIKAIWAVSKRSCSSEGDKDMLTRPLAPCLRHHSFGLREGFCWICTYAELTLTGFCTPPQRQLTRSNFYKQNAMVLESPSGIRCGRSRRRWGSPEGGSHLP